MMSLEKARTMHEEHEAFRRRTASRLQTTVENAIADGEEAIQFWSELVKVDGGTCGRCRAIGIGRRLRLCRGEATEVESGGELNSQTTCFPL